MVWEGGETREPWSWVGVNRDHKGSTCCIASELCSYSSSSLGRLGCSSSGKEGLEVEEGTLLVTFGHQRVRGEEALASLSEFGCCVPPHLRLKCTELRPLRRLARLPLIGSVARGGGFQVEKTTEPDRLVPTSGGGQQVQSLS